VPNLVLFRFIVVTVAAIYVINVGVGVRVRVVQRCATLLGPAGCIGSKSRNWSSILASIALKIDFKLYKKLL